MFCKIVAHRPSLNRIKIFCTSVSVLSKSLLTKKHNVLVFQSIYKVCNNSTLLGKQLINYAEAFAFANESD